MTDESVARAMTQPSSEWWRPTRSLAAYLTGLLIVQAFLNVVLAFVDDGQAWVRMHDALSVSGEVSNNRLSHALDDIQPWTSMAGWVSTGVLVLVIIWSFRSAHNALAARRPGARQSPGWVIAGWLIPVVSLVLPYQTVSDLWRSSEPDVPPGDEWTSRRASSLVIGWWMLKVGGSVAVGIGVVMAMIGDFSASEVRPLLVGGHLASAASCLLGILVVQTITARQTARQETEPAPTARPGGRQYAAPTSVDGPGWYPDPAGKFDHRYWDGGTWTEHVSRGGVAETAPVTPADWYPDPTGRFHWRYWTGHEWTEHVSRDQELFIDPLEEPPTEAPA